MTDDPREPPVCFRPGALAAALDARGENRNAIAKRDLERYYEIIGKELEHVHFRQADLELIIAATADRPIFAEYLWAIVQNYEPGDPEQCLSVASHIVGLTTAQTYALVDALERLHALPADTPNKLQAVGLLR